MKQHRKNNGFPFLDIFGYLKNTHKNPKFGKVRQVPNREFPTKFPDRDLSHSSKFGIFLGINSLNTQKYPKMGIRYFFLCKSLFSLGVVSSRYNIERHNFPRKLSLNVVNYLLPGFHRPVYTGRRRKSPRGRRLGGRENRREGGELGRQPSFDHSDKVSEGKKSRKSQTNKQTKKVEEEAG